MDSIKALIVDDEPLLAQNLSALLKESWSGLYILGVANNGVQALEFIENDCPDVVFLDIRMPELDGITLVKELHTREHMPLIVFTTAYEKYAIDAFEHEAVDYLLKPINQRRLQVSISRVKEKLKTQKAGKKVEQISADLVADLLQKMNIQPQQQYLEWIKASKRDNVHLVSVHDAQFFRAADKYTEVHTNDTEFIIRTSIKKLSDQLNPSAFWQINRGTIVNSAGIDMVKRDFAGRLSVILKDSDKTLRVSRNFRNVFKQM